MSNNKTIPANWRELPPGPRLDRVVSEYLGYRAVNLNDNPFGVIVKTPNVWFLVKPDTQMTEHWWREELSNAHLRRQMNDTLAFGLVGHEWSFSLDSALKFFRESTKDSILKDCKLELAFWGDTSKTSASCWYQVWFTERGDTPAHAVVRLALSIIEQTMFTSEMLTYDILETLRDASRLIVSEGHDTQGILAAHNQLLSAISSYKKESAE